MAIKSFYQKVAGDLKKLGLIDYDLRQNLSTGQKSRITKLASEYGHAIRHPEMFHIAKVGKETAKALKDSGYKVTPTNRALIPLHEFTSAKIKRGYIEFKAGNLTEKSYLAGAKDFHKKLEGITKRRLKRNEMITAKIGDSAAFNTRFSRYSDLYKYLSTFYPKDPGMTREKLYGLLSIVTIEKGSGNGKKKGTGKKGRRN